jgi:hypothetical protein
MTTDQTRMALQLRSLVRSSGELELSLVSVAIPDPAPDEVLVRIEASPLNPSDLGLLFGAADLSTATWSGTAAHPVVSGPRDVIATHLARNWKPRTIRVRQHTLTRASGNRGRTATGAGEPVG